VIKIVFTRRVNHADSPRRSSFPEQSLCESRKFVLQLLPKTGNCLSAMIEAKNLSKRYGKRLAVDDISLLAPKGTITALLGPNGAGKSTLIGIMLGQIKPDEGEVFINGFSVQKQRRAALAEIGATFEAPGFHGELTRCEVLEFLSSLTRKVSASDIEDTADFVGLNEQIHDKVRTYSRGMRLRLALAQAILPRPSVVILDEPMEGLDPAGIRDARQIIKRMQTEFGATILLSSHLLHEVAELCDHVAIVCRGKLVLSSPNGGTAAQLEETYLSVVESE
jgi:ABC-2 type transport system ATP-binding protein